MARAGVEKQQELFNLLYRLKIPPMVIYSLGGGHTHTNTHIYPHENNFKKPGARWPVAPDLTNNFT